MKHPLQEMMERRRNGEICGIPSYCSANELVLEQALRRVKELNAPTLIEATANQVNQFGGYTGMVPQDFYNMVMAMAEKMGVAENMIILAGDHLGPLTWQNLPEKEAAVLRRRYGLSGENQMSLKEIGEMYNLTKERIRQIEKKAILHLKSLF